MESLGVGDGLERLKRASAERCVLETLYCYGLAGRGFVNGRFVREVDQMLAPLRGHPDMPDLLAYMDARAAAIARAVDADQTAAPL